MNSMSTCVCRRICAQALRSRAALRGRMRRTIRPNPSASSPRNRAARTTSRRRLITPGLSAGLGQQVLVDNRPCRRHSGPDRIESAARRSHAAHYDGPVVDTAAHPERAFRSGARLRAGDAHCKHAERAGDASLASGENGARADRAREIEAGRAQLCVGRDGLGVSSRRGAFQIDGRREDRARAVQRRGTGRSGPGERPGALHVRDDDLGAAAHRRAQVETAGRHERAPLGAFPGASPDRGIGLERIRNA